MIRNQKKEQTQGHEQTVTPSTNRIAHRLGTLRLLACKASCSLRSRRLSSSVSPVASLAQPIQSVRIRNKRTHQFRSTSRTIGRISLSPWRRKGEGEARAHRSMMRSESEETDAASASWSASAARWSTASMSLTSMTDSSGIARRRPKASASPRSLAAAAALFRCRISARPSPSPFSFFPPPAIGLEKEIGQVAAWAPWRQKKLLRLGFLRRGGGRTKETTRRKGWGGDFDYVFSTEWTSDAWDPPVGVVCSDGERIF